MWSTTNDRSAAMSAAILSAVSAVLAVPEAVDAKAELGALLDEWEAARRGPTEPLVSVLTR